MDGFLGGLLFGNVDEEGQLDNDEFDKEIQEGLQSFVRSRQVTDILALSLDGLEGEKSSDVKDGKKDGPTPSPAVEAAPVAKELSVEMVRTSRLAGILFAAGSTQVRFTNLFRSAEFSHEFAQSGADGIGSAPSLRRYRLRRYKVRRRKQARAVAYAEDQRESFKRRGWGHAGAGIAGDTLVRAAMLSSSSGAISAIGGLLPGGLGSGASSRYRILSQLRASAAAIKKQSGGGPRRVGTRALDLLFERYAATEETLSPVERLGGAIKDAVRLEERQFHPVQTTCWEERIVFDEGGAAGLVPGWEAPRLTKAFVQVPKAAAPPPRPTMFGGSSRPGTPFMPGYGSFAPSRPGSGYASPQPAVAKPANLLRRPKCEATRVLNEDLERGDWLHAVIWDEAVPPAALPNTRLLLNLNDPLLLVDIEEAPAASAGISLKDISRLTKMINKAKSRRGMNGPGEAAVANPSAAQPAKAINFGKCQSGDRLNLSNDRYYDAAGTTDAAQEAAVSKATQQTLVKSQLAARIGLQHSVPALKLLPPFFRTAWTKADIRAWHRPALAGPIEPVWTFNAALPASTSGRARTASGTVVAAQVIRNAKKLSLRDAASEYVLLEYSEEHPLVLMNAGMATFIHQVYRKTGPKDPVPPIDAGYGSPKVLEPGEPSPFWMFGDVEPGKVLPAIQNNLFRAPLFEHAPPGNDFLAIRSHQKGRAASRLYLRPLPQKILLSGQTFPTAQVFGPHSRKHNNYCRGRVQAFAYRLLAKDVAAVQSGIQPRLRISRILAAFPLFSEGSVRKWLKEYADSLRGGKDSGVWVRKPDAPVLGEDALRALVTPEAVCVYEAMLAGQQRLADAGFATHTPSGAGDEDAEDRLDESPAEMQLAPWHLTANLANAIIGKSALQVRGPGEPSGGRGEAFSFAKMPTRMASSDAAAATEKRGGHRSGPDQAAYKADIARIWQAQLAALSNPVPPETEASVATPATGGDAASSAANLMDAWKDIQRTIAEDDDDDDEVVSVTSKATSRATSANQTQTTSNAPKPAGRRLVVTRTASGPNGEALLEMETLTDPFVIQAYLKERRAFDIKTRRRAQMAAAAAAKAASRPPKPAKAPKPPGKTIVPKPPSAASSSSTKSVGVRCGTCGAVGHMRTNRVCPLYAEYEASIAREAEAVRVDGTKLTISKHSLSAVKRKADKTPVARREKAVPPPLTFGQQRALGEMSLLFQDILVALTGMQSSWPFRKPVSRKDYPHYFAIIAKPLDLGTVKSRARKLAYRSPSAFLADVRLIRDNCVQFNGPEHPFSLMAGEIVGRAEEMVSEQQDKFEQCAALLDAPVLTESAEACSMAEGATDDAEHHQHDGEEDSHHEMIVDVQ